MSQFTDYLIKRINVRLHENFQKILQTTGTAKAHWLLERVDLLKLQTRTEKSILKHSEKDYIYTDDKGSFWNPNIDRKTLIW
jgi:hypothetical protein